MSSNIKVTFLYCSCHKGHMRIILTNNITAQFTRSNQIQTDIFLDNVLLWLLRYRQTWHLWIWTCKRLRASDYQRRWLTDEISVSSKHHMTSDDLEYETQDIQMVMILLWWFFVLCGAWQSVIEWERAVYSRIQGL